MGFELVWESGREKVETGGLAEGGGKGCEANSSLSEFHGLVGGLEFGDVFGASGTDGPRLCREEVELCECGASVWGCLGGPMLVILSWSSVKRPNSSARRRLSSSSWTWFVNLEALIGRRCLLSKDLGGGGRRGVWVGGESELEVYIRC